MAMLSPGLFFGSGCSQGQEATNSVEENTENKTSTTNKTELQNAGLSSDMSIVGPATEESAAVISVTLTNVSSEQQTYTLGGGRPISDFVGEPQNGRGKIVLVPETLEGVSIRDRNDDGNLELIPKSNPGDCWTIIDEMVIEDALKDVTLKPGAAISEHYRVLSDEGCASSGAYRFENELFHGEKEISWPLYVKYPMDGG